jgi:hypothetical protein
MFKQNKLCDDFQLQKSQRPQSSLYHRSGTSTTTTPTKVACSPQKLSLKPTTPLKFTPTKLRTPTTPLKLQKLSPTAPFDPFADDTIDDLSLSQSSAIEASQSSDTTPSQPDPREPVQTSVAI